MRCNQRGGFVIVAVVCGVMGLAGQVVEGTVTNDRVYRFGDIQDGGPQDENATAGATLGASSNDVTIDSESALSLPGSDVDAQHLTVSSTTTGPRYAAVGTGPLQRPGAAATDLGAQFDGVDDSLSGISLNWPAETAGPAAAGGGPAIPFYPRNYNGIDDRGMQFWVRPDGSKQNARQDIVLDSDESGGVYITATNNWGFHFDNASADSGVPVDFDQWHHVMQTTFELGAVGVMYVDGVAVAAADTTYNAEISTFSVGSNLAGDANFFKGVVDNIEVYVYGDNSTNAGPPAGQDYGAFDLATDNAYIAGLNLKPGDVNRDGEVNGNGMGPAASDDVTAFVEGWLNIREVDGVQLADLVSWEAGDLNFDSITDLEDWSILRAYHPDGPALNLMALLSVPEPSTTALLAIALAGLVVSGWCRRSLRRISPGLVLLTAIVLASTGTGWADSTIWNFDGDLTADSGPGELFFFDDPAINGTNPNFLDGGGIGATSTITTFTDTNSDPNVPGIGGVNTRVMSLPQYGQFQGLYLRHNSPATGFLADRTMMFDLYIPQNSFELFGFFAFYNSNATNTNDTDAWVRLSNGALEAAGGAGAPAGTILPDTWHRIALVNDSSKPHNALWVDGVEVAAVATSTDSFYTADSPGPGDISDPMEGLLLFADDTFDTSPGYVSSVLFADEPLSDVQLQAMGGPGAAGIPEPPDPSTLVLFASVDRDSGAVAINNQSGADLKMAAYSITSNAGALSRDGWMSFADSDDAWIEFGNDANHDLSEGTLGETDVSNGATIPLGSTWIKYFEEDLTLKYLDQDGVAYTGFIEFTGNGGIRFEFADLNFDGTLDVADWTALQDGYGADLSGLSVAEAYGLGDLTGDLAHGLDDIQTFRDAFDAANGAGAFARLTSVPEPGALVLLIMGVTLLVSRRRMLRR